MKEYKFLLTDDFFSDTYYDWLGKLLHQLKGVKIKEEDSEEISSSYSEEELANADYLITKEILSSDELWRVVQA